MNAFILEMIKDRELVFQI